ncbi:protein ALP1-like [Lotus japonicus]|uniref:protein ALP1-like n=1 Tax=Lotus japonicus TaxID=34305 RepID=UPI002582560C|nr:protein ALP1-like [Lotus japonicus]
MSTIQVIYIYGLIDPPFNVSLPISSHLLPIYFPSLPIYFPSFPISSHLLQISQKMDPPEFDLEAYLEKSKREDTYVLNHFRERRNLILEGSAPRGRKYLSRDHAGANQRLIDDYFSNEPTYDDGIFRCRYRIQKHVFLRIVADLSSSDSYFTQRVDAAKKEGISPLAKCTTAMRMLAYGVAADAVDEYIKIGETTALECVRRFCKGIIRLYEQEYMRAPTQEDLQRILQVSEMRGFPGMIGSIDCMHWEWKNCPKAWEGQFARGDKGTTTVILEAVTSPDLWIWHAFFGCPGTLNDINVLDRSPVFDELEQGNAPRVNFIVNQRPYNMAYYLADGIYPSYPTFVKSIRLPQTEPDKCFAKHQEGCRKDIERAFGVLQARFKIIREPARFWDITDLGIIMRSCIILHNMIVEDERDTYAQRWTDFEQAEGSESSTPQPYSTEVLPAFADHVRARSEFRDPNVHHQLQADLVKHIWAKFGMYDD